MKKTIWVAIIVLILGGLIWWSQSKNNVLVQGESIKIGGLFSLSGYAAFAGEAARDGMIMAIEDSGMDVDYVIEDFKSDQKSLVTGASKLVDIDKVQVVIGPEWAEFGEVVTPLADKNKIPFISPWMDQETEWLKSPYFFSMTPSAREQNSKTLEYMSDNGVKNIAIVYSNNSWSLSNLGLFKDEVKKNGKINIVSEFKSNEDATDFRTDISKIGQLKPDAIYSILSAGGVHGIFSKQMQEMGFKYPVYSTDTRAEDSVIKDRFYQYVIGQLYSKAKESERTQEFNEKYEKRFGRKVAAISAATAYDATTIVLNAIKSGAKDSEDIKDYFDNVKKYYGYSNTISFNEFGQVSTGEAVIKQVTKDGYIIVK